MLTPSSRISSASLVRARVACTRSWRSTHAYVISREAMVAWQNLTTAVGDQPIDFVLPNRYVRAQDPTLTLTLTRALTRALTG